MENMLVTKENGKQESFSIQKFRSSLQRANVGLEEIDLVIERLESKMFSGIKTREIYKIASQMLKSNTPAHAARFGLKKAIMELGPSGFPFERFVAKLFEYEGFSTQTGIIMQGHCISHELDVVGRKAPELMLVECKYHNHAGIFVEVKVPMYIHSRFQDLIENGLLDKDCPKFTGWVATNVRFSFDAIKFANCKGINLLGWDYPVGMALKDRIERTGLYPVTCLTTISSAEKKYLLQNEIVLVKGLVESDWLTKAGVSQSRMRKVKDEISELNR